MTDRFVYQYSPEELAAAQRHAKRSMAPRECVECKKGRAPTAQMVLFPRGLVCWVCHILAGGQP
jgi:hypothetical protein